MTIANKIVKLRKAKGMTQSDLGKELNITYQAVSKWERGESLPDFETVSKLAKIFGVPITYFEDDGQSNDGAESVDAAESGATEQNNGDGTADDGMTAVVGMCVSCGRILHDGEQDTGFDKVMCVSCANEKRKKLEQERQAAERARESARRKQAADQAAQKAKFRKRVVIASIVGVIVTAVSLAAQIGGAVYSASHMPDMFAVMVVCSVFVPLMVFMWVFQLFFDGIARMVTCWGLQIIKLPGIIFSADLSGLIFLVVMKVFLTILAGLISLVLICATSVIGMVVGIFTFVPLTIKIHRCEEDIL